MKIVALETLRPAVQPNLLFVRLHADNGLVGLGDAFFGAQVVETYLHGIAAETLFSLDDVTPARAAARLASYTGYAGAGAETRGNGALDVALWDLLGQAARLPLCDLLGGPLAEQVKVYNTCAGPDYVRRSTRQASDNWGLPRGQADASELDDLHAFLTDPGRLARQLLEEGIRGMKVWPFDRYGEATGGTSISADDLARGVGVLEAIRAEVGPTMDLMVELHGLWNRHAATRILNAIAPLQPLWVEDPIRPDAVDALAVLARDTRVPIATGETCVGRRAFLPLLAAGAVSVATVDVQWTGGLTEAHKIATLADAYGVPVAPHDCTGPVTLAACLHLTASQPNGLVQETVRAFVRTWYAELVTGLPEIRDGYMAVPRTPGHGVRLREDVPSRPDVIRAMSAA